MNLGDGPGNKVHNGSLFADTIKKAEVRKQRAEGIPINKFKGFSF